MTIPPFVILVAFLPLAAYLTLFGAIRMFGRPMVTTGARDFVAVAVAVSGLLLVGPIDLFFPESTAAMIGYRVWFVLAFLYSLIVLLIVISSRPRLIVYGIRADQLLPMLTQAAATLDTAATLDREAGTITLPTLGLHLRVDDHRGTDIAEVFAFETSIQPMFWRHLRFALTSELANAPRTTPRGGSIALLAGIVILMSIFYVTFTSHTAVVQGLQTWLSR